MSSNFALDRTAGSHSLAAAGHRERYAAETVVRRSPDTYDAMVSASLEPNFASAGICGAKDQGFDQFNKGSRRVV